MAGSVQIGKWGWGKQSLDGLVAALDKHREQVFVSTGSQPVRVSVQRAQPLAKLSKCWLCNRKLHDSKSVLGSTCRQHILRMLRALELKKETFDYLRALMHTDPAEFKKVFADKGYDATLKELKAEVRDALREGTGENEYEVRHSKEPLKCPPCLLPSDSLVAKRSYVICKVCDNVLSNFHASLFRSLLCKRTWATTTTSSTTQTSQER